MYSLVLTKIFSVRSQGSQTDRIVREGFCGLGVYKECSLHVKVTVAGTALYSRYFLCFPPLDWFLFYRIVWDDDGSD